MANCIIEDLLLLNPFPRRYPITPGLPGEYWAGVVRKYADEMKRIRLSGTKWWVIEFTDGRRELARLRVLKGTLFSGKYPAIYRGPLIPHYVDYGTIAKVKRIRPAF